MDTQENIEELSAAGWTENLFQVPISRRIKNFQVQMKCFFVKLKNMTHFVQFSEL